MTNESNYTLQLLTQVCLYTGSGQSAICNTLVCRIELTCQPIAVPISEVVVVASACASTAHQERYRVEHTDA